MIVELKFMKFLILSRVKKKLSVEDISNEIGRGRIYESLEDFLIFLPNYGFSASIKDFVIFLKRSELWTFADTELDSKHYRHHLYCDIEIADGDDYNSLEFRKLNKKDCKKLKIDIM